MEPLKTLIARAWESLTEGWRELLTRNNGALTHFGTEAQPASGAAQDFPSWSLLAAETWETALSVVIRVEIPGMERDDLTVDVHETMVRVRGERHSGNGEERHYHLMERAYGYFERSIPLPRGVDAQHAEVSYREGVLTVILPKIEPMPPIRPAVSG